jgi:two-component system cell cycle sensor histidine kinase/response regulator CckA
VSDVSGISISNRTPVIVLTGLLMASMVGLTVALVLPEDVGYRGILALYVPLLLIAAFSGLIVLFLMRRAQRMAEARCRLDWVDALASAVMVTDKKGNVLKANQAADGIATDGVLLTENGVEMDLAELRRSQTARLVRIGDRTARVSLLPGDHYLWALTHSHEVEPVTASGMNALPRFTVGRSGAILWMNDALRSLVGGKRKNLRELFVTLPLEHGQGSLLRGKEALQNMITLQISEVAGRREIVLVPAPDEPAVSKDAFEDLPVALLTCTSSGTILRSNRAARLLVNGLEGDAHAHPAELSVLFEGLGRPLADWLRQAASGDLAGQSEFMRLSASQDERYVQVTVSPVVSAANGTELLITLADATDIKALEAKFAQSQKMQAIGQLAGGIAHDFNNLLTAIAGHCDLLLLRHDPMDPEYADLIQINQNANRAAALVGQLLAFSRKQTLHPESLKLPDVLGELTHLLNRLVGERVTLSLEHTPNLATVRADKRQVEQVIMNLVVNARDAMPEGGEIRISTEMKEYSAPVLRDRALIPSGRYVVISVADHGCGVPKDLRTKIFEPFYTSKKSGEGTGLGLSTAYGIVKQSGGFIFIRDGQEKGAVFDVFLPAEEPSQVELHEKKLEPLRLKHGDGRVLLVEDEAPVRAFAERALKLRGYDIVAVGSAEDALAILENGNDQFDVVVTDVIMPGMDGPTWVSQALKSRPDLRVIFVSGYAEETFSDARTKIPHSAFLPKPFSLGELTKAVEAQFAH